MEAVMPRPARPTPSRGLDAFDAAISRSSVRLPVAPRLLFSKLPFAVHEQLHEICFGTADNLFNKKFRICAWLCVVPNFRDYTVNRCHIKLSLKKKNLDYVPNLSRSAHRRLCHQLPHLPAPSAVELEIAYHRSDMQQGIGIWIV
jgi:hypothetical protein